MCSLTPAKQNKIWLLEKKKRSRCNEPGAGTAAEHLSSVNIFDAAFMLRAITKSTNKTPAPQLHDSIVL